MNLGLWKGEKYVFIGDLKKPYSIRKNNPFHYKKKRIRQRFEYVVNYIQQRGPARC